MPPLAIAQNDLSEPDPTRAAELESAIQAAVGPLAERI
jgi:hypothetical protein